MREELLSVKQVSKELGGVPISTIQKHIREGKLKATKNGRCYLVTRSDLNCYLGIDNTSEMLSKDFEIAQLKQKLTACEQKLKTVEMFLNNLNIAIAS